MFRLTSLLTIMMPAMAFAGDSEYFHGDATAYTLSHVSAGNCNFMYDPGVGHNYAALNAEQWDSTRNCGRCAQVWCDDSRCTNKNSTTVYIVDRCPECAKGSLDLSPIVFKQLTNSDPSRYKIKWQFVTCPVSGNINYCTKSGSSSSWLAVQPTNHASGVASMKIANQEVTMVDSCYYFLLNGGKNVDTSAVNIEITSVTGETITETLALTSDSCTVGTANFGKGTIQTSTSQTPPTIQPAPIPGPSPTTPTTPTTVHPAPISGPSPTTPTATAPTIETATPTSATSSYTFTNGSSSQIQSQSQMPEQQEQQGQSEVTNSFVSLMTNSSSGSDPKYKSGSVIAANESERQVKILQSSDEKISSVQQNDESESSKQPAASDVEHVNTKAKSLSSGTSTVVVTFIVLAVVCGFAFATVIYVVKKKRLNDKRIDQDMAMMRSFDTFSSPVHFDVTIAKI